MSGDLRFEHDVDVRRHAVALFDAHWGCRPVASKLDEYIAYWNTMRGQIVLKGLTPGEFRNQSLAA